MEEIELFIQGEGLDEIALVRMAHGATVRDVVVAAKMHGLPDADEPFVVLLEDEEVALPLDAALSDTGLRHRGRVHIHRVPRIDVTVHFVSDTKAHTFSSSATVRRVKEWADEQFKLPRVDATEHVLQLCNSNVRPDEDTHIGRLVRYPDHALCFDLVAKHRVEG